MKNKSKTHKNYRTDWATPWDVMAEIARAFQEMDAIFTLDVAADEHNKKCPYFYSKEINALNDAIQWHASLFKHLNESGFNALWWCNPPFNMAEKFLEKAEKELEKGNEGLMILPGNQETRWFRGYITDKNRPRLVWPQRIKFIDPETGEPGDGNPVHTVLIPFMRDYRQLPKNIAGQPWLNNYEFC